MQGTLLGIKIIGWFFIIFSFGNFIQEIQAENYIVAFISLSIGLALGIGLLRKKELGRKFTIFASYFSIVTFIISMFFVPMIGIHMQKTYENRQISYDKLISTLNKLKKENVPESEITKTEAELAKLKDHIQRYPDLKKIMDETNDFFAFHSNFLYILIYIIIIYYLKKPYVVKQFSL